MLRGVGFVVGTPRAWLPSLVPAIVLTGLGLFFAWVSLVGLRPWFATALPHATTWVGRFGVQAAAWIGGLLAVMLGLLVAALLAPPLSGPALERIVELKEAAVGAPPRRPIGWLGEIGCALRAQAVAALVALCGLGALTVLEFFLPVAAPVIAVLRFFVVSLSVAWNLLDYPLTLRGVDVGSRLAFVRHHFGATLGFGIAFALLFWLPCCGIILLPVGAAAATDLVWGILFSEPTTLPVIARTREQ